MTTSAIVEGMTLRCATTGTRTPPHGRRYVATRWFFNEKDGYIEQEPDVQSYEALGVAYDGFRVIGFFPTFKEAVIALRDWVRPKQPKIGER